MAFSNYLQKHQNKYGNNLIVLSNRMPKNDYYLIDRKLFDDYKIKYNNENIIVELFDSGFFNLGYIDFFDK